MAKDKATSNAKPPEAETTRPLERARPAARRQETTDAPIVASRVAILVHRTGNNGVLADAPLHEIPLLRRKIAALGGDGLKLLGEWPSNVDRIRGLTLSNLKDEYDALRARYTFDKPGGREGEQLDLMMDVYGPPHQGRLVAVMRRLEAAWRKMIATVPEGEEPNEEDLEQVLSLADPEADFLPLDAAGIET